MIEISEGANENKSNKNKANAYLRIEEDFLLVVSYFDLVVGPKILYCGNDLKNFKKIEIRNIMDVVESGTFIFAIEEYRTLNHVFNVESQLTRGGKDTIMVSFIIKNAIIENSFRYLESKATILQEFGSEIKKIKELPQILREKHKPDDILQLFSVEGRKRFLNLYKKYQKELYIDFKINLFTNIKANCPFCNKVSYLQIPLRVLDHDHRKANILVPKYRVCEHSFMLLIDRYFKVRSYQKIDYKVLSETKRYLNPHNIDVFHLKLDIKPEILIAAIEAIFHNKKVLFVLERDSQLKGILINFFNYVFQDTFNFNVMIKKNDYYSKNKHIFEDFIVFKVMKGEICLNDANFARKYKLEREIVIQFYNETNSIIAINNLRDKIREFYIISKKICQLHDIMGKYRYLSRKRVIRYLENEFYVKIKKDYFDFLNEIVKKYFNKDIKWLHEYLAEKIENLWRSSSKRRL